MKARAGSALAELLTAAALLGIVCAVCGLLLHAGGMLLRNVSEHTATEEALRTARGVVKSELRSASSGDLHAVSSDSVSSRIFRGWGLVCGADETRVLLRYRGLREPDADKDSLLVAGEDRVGIFRVASDRSARCVTRAEEHLVILTPSIPLRPGNVVLLFETGAYHIATHALRYRRAGESRQPLTDDQIDERRSFFQWDPRGGIRLLLRAGGNDASDSLASDSRFRLLN